MSDLRPVGYVIGLLVATLGAVMLLPFVVDLIEGDGNWPVFLGCAAITALIGAALALACANGAGQGLTIQQSFLLTTGTWVVLPLFGAVPFMLGAPHVGLTDAYFEAMSGLTTTARPSSPTSTICPQGRCCGAVCCNGWAAWGS